MLDLLITNATLPDGRTGMSVAVQDGTIVIRHPRAGGDPDARTARCS